MVAEGLEDILSGIEHPLGLNTPLLLGYGMADMEYICIGRMLYTTGDVTGAVQLFLGLVRGAASFSYSARLLQDGTKISGNDKIYLDDFRVAYSVSLIIQICTFAHRHSAHKLHCSISSRLNLKKLIQLCYRYLSRFVRLVVYD